MGADTVEKLPVDAASQRFVGYSSDDFPINPFKSDSFVRDDRLSIRLGADVVFREQKRYNSLQIRYYKKTDQYVVQLDRHNPKYGPIAAVQHAVIDATRHTTLFFGVLAAVYFGRRLPRRLLPET